MTTRLAAALIAFASTASVADERAVTVAYFENWPLPALFGKAEGLYAEALGAPVTWRAFDTGTAMSVALAAGEVDIALSHGAPPVAVALSSGVDLIVADVAVSYAENDNCVAREGLKIGSDAAEGLRVSAPLGTAAHYGLLRQMEHFGVDIAALEIVNLAPEAGADALAAGDVDIACGWGGALARMLEQGEALMTGAEKEAIGLLVFDVTSVRGAFARANPEQVTAFLRITAEMNVGWAEAADDRLPRIAEASGMIEDAARGALAGFTFLTPERQLSEDWLGGGVARHLKRTADFFLDQGLIVETLESYESAVDPSYLAAASR